MKSHTLHLLALTFAGLFSVGNSLATNPLIMDQFTADPTARVFGGKVYVSHRHAQTDYHTESGWRLWIKSPKPRLHFFDGKRRFVLAAPA